MTDFRCDFLYTIFMNEPSLFARIINGEIPCYKVYEDESTLAFLDINPVNDGHTLVVPKKEVEFIWDLDEVDYQALMWTVYKVGRRIKAVTDKKYLGQLVVGTDVPHVHVHLVPFDESVEIKRVFGADRSQAEPAILAKIAESLYFS